jgi:GNAT superfamily N-acetyltransferase
VSWTRRRGACIVAVFTLAVWSSWTVCAGAGQAVAQGGPTAAAPRAVPASEGGLDWSLVINGLVGLFTAGTVIAALMAIRMTERGATANVVHARKLSTVDHVLERQQRYHDLVAEIGDLGDGDIPPEQWRRLLLLIGIWEITAAGVTAGVFDIEVLNKSTGAHILTTYRCYARFIRRRRRENPRIYDQLEVLIDKLLLMQASRFLIDRAALRRMRQLGMPDRTVSELSRLRTKKQYTYNSLLRALIDRNLETEKTIVMSCARRSAVDVQRAVDTDRADVTALFERAQAHTDGAYPPRSRTDQVGGIAAWLALPPIHDRFLVRRGSNVAAYVELEDLDRLRADDRDDDDAARERVAYWYRAFEAHPRFARDPTMQLERLMIVKRLVVDPAHQRAGLGRILLRYAIQVIQFSHDQIPALVVLSTLEPAIKLYESEGATRIGSFKGHAGHDLHSYVF